MSKIAVDRLQPGMYVAELDRPWTETPFLFQGFVIESRSEISILQRYCQYVYVDATRSRQMSEPGSGPVFRGDHQYEDQVSVSEEYERAEAAYDEAQSVLAGTLDALCEGGRLEASTVQDAVAGIVTSIVRNPDAFMYLMQVRKKDSYIYDHLVAACGLAVAFGRHLGLSPDDLRELTLGAALFDIGKVRIPDEILSKPSRLGAEEFERVKEHARLGAEILEADGNFSMTVIEAVRYHHERHDGSGYPDGLTSDDTPLFAQIVGLADAYDAITSDRPYRAAMSPHAAIKEMYRWRGTQFHPDLVEEFIQTLGVYPTGTLVELNTGQIGVVIAQNRTRRLRPKVVLLRDPDGRPYDIYPAVDLMTEATDHLGNPLEIRRAVDDAEALGIDVTELAF